MNLIPPRELAYVVERRFCYGIATEAAVKECVATQGKNGAYDMPYLRALLGLLEANGHDVNDIRMELERMASIVYASRDAFYPGPPVLGRGAGRF
jgi:hypothetical protein